MPSDRRGLRILLVEDNADSRLLFATALRRAGHEVVEAGSGEKAVLLASLIMPDLILLDIGLPGMSGHGVAAELRAHSEVPRAPIIAVTAGRLDAATRAELGIADVFYKPILPAELADRVGAWWAARGSSPPSDGS
jgi:DNA-binding response OmpR family regulator